MIAAATGVADHSGWALFVTVALDEFRPMLLDTRRVALIADGLPRQPYEHDTIGMEPHAADTLVERVRASALAHAGDAFVRLRKDLAPYSIESMAIRTPTLTYLPDRVEDVHASYAMTCRADGMLYHNALCTAAELCGLEVVMRDRGTEEHGAAGALGIAAWEIKPLLQQLGREARSWTAEHRRAAASAIGCLRAETNQ